LVVRYSVRGLEAVVLVVAFQNFFNYAPPMQRLFGTESIGLNDWALILLVSVNVVWIVEVDKWIARQRSWHRFAAREEAVLAQRPVAGASGQNTGSKKAVTRNITSVSGMPSFK
jgi:hypothetical protein